MTRTPALASILSELPRARRALAPLRAVWEKHYGEPLPPIEFPVPAFVTERLPREEAWALFRELRGDARLSNVAIVVTTEDFLPLPDLWEDACPVAEQFLSLRAERREPQSSAASDGARQWVKSPAGRRALESSAKKPAKRVAAPGIQWLTSVRDPYASGDTQTVYVLDVEPWASPLALAWLLTLERWSEVAWTLERWHEAHGFTVVALTGDLLEAWVERPATTAEELGIRLVEAASFCGGHLDEGFAPRLDMLRQHAWRFRFDG